MNKYKYLLENTLIFALSGIIVKILSFFMLPLYTRMLTTSDYGIAELINTTVTLLMPFFSLSIAEAVIRYMLIKDYNKSSIFTIATLIIVAGGILLLLFKPVFSMVSEEIDTYFTYFILIYFTTTVEQMLFKFAKGLEKVKECSINAIVIVSVTICSNLILLLKFNMGLSGYLTSIIAAQIVSSIYLAIVCKVWRYFDIKSISKTVIREMLFYSIPFIPSAIAWWVNSAFDRYMIVYMLGVTANGLFGAASKLPATINVVTSVFTQAWQLSGIKEFEEEGYDKFFSNIYNMYNAVMVICVAVLIPLTPLIARFLFSGEFYKAWVYAPVLYIASVFTGISGVLASAFYAVKQTKFLMRSTLIGAAVNIGLNYVLIKAIGIQGAGIATMVSFATVYLVRYFSAKRYINLDINIFKTVLTYALLMLQAMIMALQIKFMYVISVMICIFIVVLNMSEVKKMVEKSNIIIKKLIGGRK